MQPRGNLFDHSFTVIHPSMVIGDLETELAKNAPSGLLQRARKRRMRRRRGAACSAAGGGEPDADATTIRSTDHTGREGSVLL